MTDESRPRKSLQRKRSSRLAAVQGLYQRDVMQSSISGEKLSEQLSAQWRDSIDTHDIEWPSDAMPEVALMRDILDGVITNQTAIDTTLESVIKADWKVARMNPVMLAILRSATFELNFRPDRKHAVILDEYVSLASGFFEGNELGYIHSALQQISSNKPHSTDA